MCVILIIYLYTKHKKVRDTMAKHSNSRYEAISEDIKAKIKDGTYKYGQMLEPERKLMETYSSVRTTIRRALDLLVEQGFLVKKTGVGSFISDGKTKVPVHENNPEVKVSKTASGRKTLPKKITVKEDYKTGAEMIFDEITSLGHEKIICVNCNDELFASLSGEAAKRNLYDANLFLPMHKRYDAEDLFLNAYRSTRDAKATCVITENEDDAEKIYKLAERIRILIPEELSLVCVKTSKSSEFAGCCFDIAKTEKSLIKMLEFTSDADIPEITVLSTPVFLKTSTLTNAKKQSSSSKMSDYLL